MPKMYVLDRITVVKKNWKLHKFGIFYQRNIMHINKYVFRAL